jgi:ATP-binding cassette subfamily B protein
MAMPDARSEASAEPKPFDRQAYYLAAKKTPRSMRSLPRLARSAMRLSRDASPRLFYLSAAAQIVIAGLLAVQVLLGKIALQEILEADRSGGSVSDALPPLIGLVAAGALGSFAGTFQTLAQRLLGERVRQTTLDDTLEVTTAVELETFESPEFFDDLQRVQTNALIQPLTMSQGLIATFGGLLGVAGLTAALLVIEPLIVPILLVSALPLWLVSRATGRLEFNFNYLQTPGHRLRFYLVETLIGRQDAKEVRAFGLGKILRGRWADSYATYMDDLRTHVKRRLLLALGGTLATVVVTSAAFGLLIWFVLEDRIGLAEAGAAVLGIRLLGSRIEQVFKGITGLFESSMFLDDFHRFLRRKPAPPDSGAPKRAGGPFRELVVDNVHFTYPNSDNEALKGISMRIGPGEVVALVGENGSGKTTLAKLIGTLFTPTEGRVLWGGEDVRALDREDVRRQVGIIFQDFVRYQLTARENIGYGRPEAVDDVEGIAEAARQAGADAFLERLPDGYETVLGKEFTGGYDLSLGQWQRIALARAFFREARLLVLDEPTASLDARSEHELFEYVQALAHGRSVLLISHRFSTVKSADRIYVLHHGEIVEDGSHEELLAEGGRYAELFGLQAAAYR